MRVFVVLGFVLVVFVFTTGHVLLTTRSTPFPHETSVSVPLPSARSTDNRWFPFNELPEVGLASVSRWFRQENALRSAAHPFTLTQLAWMAEHPVVSVSLRFSAESPPQDADLHTGLSLDLLRLLSQRTGLRFRMEPDSFGEADLRMGTAAQKDAFTGPTGASGPEHFQEQNALKLHESAFKSLAMTVRPQVPELHAILQTALYSLTPAERQTLSRRWLEEDSEFGEFWFSGRPFWLGLLVLQGVAGVLLLVLFWNFQLRRKVEERTQRLAVELEKSARTEILEDLNAELREAAEAKSRFLANISHEIRTPLHGIISFTELAYLKNQALPRKHQRTILDLAYALLDIVNDTLDFSKIEAGGMKTDIGPFALDDVIRRVCDMTIHGSRARELACVVDIDPATPPALVGDASRLQQVLTNLMSNAVKFTPPGGRVHLQVRPASTRMAGGAALTRLLFFVHDTGVGIAPEHLQRLFKPFGQVDASLTRQRGGTGLGLSIARHMLEKMGGEIWVESEPGQGSTFAFSLPFGLQEQVEALAASSFVGMQALVVGGTELGAAALARTLEALGFRVLSVFKGAVPNLAEALRTVSAEAAPFTPDVLVIDRLHGEEPRSQALPVLDVLNRHFPELLPVLFFGGPQEELAAESRRAPQENAPSQQRMEVVRAVSLGILRSALRTLMGKGAHVGLWARPGYRIPDLSGTRLLVVEDNPVNREIMAALLEDTRAEVHMATNGLQALNILEQPPLGKAFDLIFLDIQMPDMDGYATIRAIREKGRTLPVVAITAHAMQADKQRCLDAGMDAYLSKPFKQALLFDVIQHLLPNLCKTQLDAPAPDTAHMDLSLPPCFSETVVRQTGLTAARFRQVLQSFVRSHSRDESLLRRFAQHMTSESLTSLQEHAHTLKGASANLGAQELRQAALALEREAAARLAHNNLSPFPRRLLDELGGALTTVLVAAESLQASQAVGGQTVTALPQAALPEAALPESLHKLATALREASPERVREAAALLPASTNPLHQRFLEQVQDYDYEAALETLFALHPALCSHFAEDTVHAQ